jgi:oxygen-dependent protoporphyrinogen oxidase
VLRSRTLSWSALARAGLEPAAAHRMPALAEDADVSVGDFVSRRFGPAVSRTFVDPLLGGLHAGDVSRLSLRSCAPGLVAAATDGRSLVLRRRGPRGSIPMSFVTWPEGLSALTSRLLADCPDVEVHTGVAVTSLARTAAGQYEVTTPAGVTVVDAVVLAVPARVAAALLDHLAPEPARGLREVEYAGVVTMLAGVPAGPARTCLRGTGLLVPAGSGRLLKAATYLGHKWPHLAAGETCWVRLSAGRVGDRRAQDLSDDDLAAGLLGDLRDITGFAAPPTAVVLRRWPAALPQLTVGHATRLAAVRAALPPGVALAGASYDGLGLASGIRSGAAAAAALTAPQEG